MPKIKTHKGILKRVKKTGTGKVKRTKAFRSHILTKKSAKRKRGLRQPAFVHESMEKKYSRLLPYN